MRIALVTTAALTWFACVSAPPLPFTDGGVDGGTEPVFCQDPGTCAYPPDDDEWAGKVVVVDTVTAKVNGNEDVDLVITNGPADPADSRFWGFFFSADINASGAITSRFVRTGVLPSAVFIDESFDASASIVVFGNDTNGEAKMEVYGFEEGSFARKNDPEVVVPQNLWGLGSGVAPQFIVTGEFTDWTTGAGQKPDVLIGGRDAAGDTELYVRRCNTSTCTWEAFGVSENLSWGKVRYIDKRPSVTAPPAGLWYLDGTGKEDLVISGINPEGNGYTAWITWAESLESNPAGPNGSYEFQALTHDSEGQPVQIDGAAGTMSTLSAAASINYEDDNGTGAGQIDLILAGLEALDITTFEVPPSPQDPNNPISQISRLRFGNEPTNPELKGASGVAAYLSRNRFDVGDDVDIAWVAVDQAGDGERRLFLSENVVPLWSDSAFQAATARIDDIGDDVAGIQVVYPPVERSPKVLVFGRDGEIRCFETSTPGTTGQFGVLAPCSQ